MASLNDPNNNGDFLVETALADLRDRYSEGTEQEVAISFLASIILDLTSSPFREK